MFSGVIEVKLAANRQRRQQQRQQPEHFPPPWEAEIQELPDGRLLCDHGLVVCGICCVDYSFMDEEQDGSADESEEGDEDTVDPERNAQLLSWLQSKIRNARPVEDSEEQNTVYGGESVASSRPGGVRPVTRGTGRVFAKKFELPWPTCTPEELFPQGIGRRASPHVSRFICHSNPRQMLIYTDGACLDNGQAHAKAGWAFVFKPGDERNNGIVSGGLEKLGPFGEECAQTSNRAELRAVLAAFRFRAWFGEGFNSLVIATDSEYVAEGTVNWAQKWAQNGWRTRAGQAVKNKDLWEAVMGEIEYGHSLGINIKFWRIPRELNTVADGAAKEAADTSSLPIEYEDVFGMLD